MGIIVLSFSNGPSGFLRIPFAPPAIQDAHVENTVYCAFIPDVPQASSGRLGVLSHTSAPCTRSLAI